MWRNFAVAILTGFVVLALAFGLGSMTGEILSSEPALVALRFLGGGLILAGMTMWIMYVRSEAGSESINPLLAFTMIGGPLMLVLNILNPSNNLNAILSWGGLGINLVGLAIGLLSMLIAPTNLQSQATTLPESHGTEHNHDRGTH